ncbi:hypothetical protein ACU5DF_23875 [Aliivibrio wodanis]
MYKIQVCPVQHRHKKAVETPEAYYSINALADYIIPNQKQQ